MIKFHEMMLKKDMTNCIDPTENIDNIMIRKEWGKAKLESNLFTFEDYNICWFYILWQEYIPNEII